MELPEHSCINCAYLFQSDKDGTISRIQRETALIDKNNRWNNGQINYELLVCYMGEKNFPDYNINKAVIDIRNEAIRPDNSCKKWTAFTGISPMATEQRKNAKWIRPTFFVACGGIIATLVIWVLTQFVIGD